MSEKEDIIDLIRELNSPAQGLSSNDQELSNPIPPEFDQDITSVKVEDPVIGQSAIIKREVISDPRILPIFSSDSSSDRYYLNYKSGDFHYILSDGVTVDYGSCSINDRQQIKEIMSHAKYITNYDYYKLPFYIIGGRQLPVESTQISMTQITNQVTKSISHEHSEAELWLTSPGEHPDRCADLLVSVLELDADRAHQLVESFPSNLGSYDSEDQVSSLISQLKDDSSYDPSMSFESRSVPLVESSSSESQSQSQSQTTESYTASFVKYHLFTDKGEVIFTVDQYSVPQISSVKNLNDWFVDIINHVPLQSISFTPYSESLSSDFKYIRPNLIQIDNNFYTLKTGFTQFIDFYRFLTCLRTYKDHDRFNCFVHYLTDMI